VYSPYTYAATMVVGTAMKRAGSADPKVYGAKLAATDYTGITARVQFEPNGERKTPSMTLFAYRDGKKTELN